MVYTFFLLNCIIQQFFFIWRFKIFWRQLYSHKHAHVTLQAGMVALRKQMQAYVPEIVCFYPRLAWKISTVNSTHKTQMKSVLVRLACHTGRRWRDELFRILSLERARTAGAWRSLCVGLLFVRRKRLLFSGSNQTTLGLCKDPVPFSSQLLHTPC